MRPRRRTRLRELEGRVWTGRLAHLAGGVLDVSGALLRYARSRACGRR